MKKHLVFFLILSLVSFISIFANGLPERGWVSLCSASEGNGTPEFKILDIRSNSIVIEVNLEGFEVFREIEDDIEYLRIRIPDTIHLQEIGKPELPQFGTLLQFPFDSEFSYRIIDKETITYDNVLMYPTQEKPARSNPGLRYPFFIDEDFYKSDITYPQEMAFLGDAGILRDVYVARLGIFPFQYNPQDMRLNVHRSITIQVDIEDGAFNPLFRNNTVSHAFHNLYERIILNYDENSRGIRTEAESMLVFIADDLESTVQPLLDWKNSRGIKVYKMLMSDIGADTASIKDAIQEAYDTYTPKPSYVLLVGHANTVPPNYRSTQFGNAASDYPYTLLEDDQYPDILIGRILAENTDQAEVQVSKLINYEQYPFLGAEGDFYSEGFGIASNEGSNPSDEDYITSIGDYLTDGTYTHYDHFFQGSGNATAANISAAINEGRTWITYIGHGSGTSWSNTNTTFNNTTVHNLSNGFKLPIIVDVACLNGRFDALAECFGEAWMWAGDPADPKGAVGYYGGSVSVSWHPPAVMSVGVAKHHFEDPVHTLGGSLLAGQMYLVEQMGWNSNTEDNFEWYNLFGDPSMLIRTANPHILDVDHPVIIPAGSTSVSVNVGTQDKGPFEGALVCIYASNNSDIYASAYTDASGDVILSFDMPMITTDEIYITVSGYNTSVYQTDIMVGSTSDGIINLDRSLYSCDDTAIISLIDEDLEGQGTHAVNVSSDTDPVGVDIVLTETDIDGFFQGEVIIGTDIAVSHNDTLTVTYFDADIGDGTSEYKTDTALIDCMGPEFFNMDIISITGNSASITFETDENAVTSFNYGTDPDNLNMTQTVSTSYRTSHTGTISGLDPDTNYYFEIIGADIVHNENTSEVFNFRTLNIMHVGDGTHEISQAPLYCYWKVNRAQVIYHAEDLGNDQLLINSLAFEVTQEPVLTLTNWTIRMKHTNKDDHSGGEGFETEDWIIVYQNDEDINETGWITFELDEPFYYDGIQNLMIDFSFHNSSWQNPYGIVKWTQADESRTARAHNDTGGDPLIWSGTGIQNYATENYYINLQLGLENIDPEPDGTVRFNRDSYGCDSEVKITVRDSNVGEDFVFITVISTSDEEGWEGNLSETEFGIFEGTITLGIDVNVEHGDILTVTYLDEDIGDGTQEEKTDTAIIDCLPEAPSDLTANTITNEQIDLSWTDNSDNEDGFTVERRLGIDGSWEDIATLSQNTEEYSDTDVEPNNLYFYRVYAFNDSGNSPYSNEASAHTLTLADALNNTELIWTTDGNAEWFPQTDEFHYGGSSAQSGPITHSQSTSLHTTVEGPGELSFYWKVSSENNYDWLRFYINGVQQNQISGEQSWHQMTYDIPHGTHDLTWTYIKDHIVTSGQDTGWVDLVEYEQFELEESSVTLLVDPDTISGDADPQGAGDYYTFDDVDISVQPVSGYAFIGWTGTHAHLLDDSSSMSTSFIMPDHDVEFTAVFEEEYSVTLLVDPDIISGDADPQGAGDYYNLQDVDISVQAVSGYAFIGWTGTHAHLLDDSSSMSTSFTMPDHDVEFTAEFEESFPPDAPSDLLAVAISETEIDLSWTDNSDDEEGFKIERRTGESGSWSQITETGANIESYSDTGLEEGTLYYYRVRAFNDAGNSPYSNEAHATTHSEDIESVSVFRFFNTLSGGHLYTVSELERDYIIDNLPEWDYEGISFEVYLEPVSDTTEAYRFFNTQTGIHLYTISEHERDHIIDNLPEWNYEGISFNVYEDPGADSIPVFRFFNTARGGHLYTISEYERDYIIDNLPEWNYEGIAFYVLSLEKMKSLFTNSAREDLKGILNN